MVKADADGATCSSTSLLLFQGRKRRKVRWSNTRTHRKKRSSEDEASNPGSSEEEESEDQDDSDEDYKVERKRRRRNRQRERQSSDSSTSSDDDLPPNDDPCKHCGLPNHPELVGAPQGQAGLGTFCSDADQLLGSLQILLCDWCDSGYHTACLRPPLMVIPDGEWFCPPCQHVGHCRAPAPPQGPKSPPLLPLTEAAV